jgi:putative nucleotidyltransferase with HDIG domain
MSEPARFLTSMAQAISAMVLYASGHPARQKAIDASHEQLVLLQTNESLRPQFSFLGGEVIFGQRTLRELKEWDWGMRLANAGIQRLEFTDVVSREDYEAFLDEAMARLTLASIDTAAARPERRTSIRYGAIGVKGMTQAQLGHSEGGLLPTATISYTLREEADAVRWMHDEVQQLGQLPLIEAEAVVRSLSVAMHADSEIVIPLVQLKEFDQYTTTHSLNVSILAMALAEFIGLGARDVRAFGVAGLLHDLGKVRIPKEILTKPGRLTEAEFTVMKRHPVDGARLIIESDRQLDLAAVVAYEHHVMLNGGGYPCMHYGRECHHASKLVHICDVYDALRTKRPYRDAWTAEATLEHITTRAGTEFDPDLVRAFSAMMQKWEGRVAVVDDETSVLREEPAPPTAVVTG